MPFDKKLTLDTLRTLSGLYSASPTDSDAISRQENILIDQINEVPNDASSKEFFIDTMYLGGETSSRDENGKRHTLVPRLVLSSVKDKKEYTYKHISQFIFNLCSYSVLDAYLKKMEAQPNLAAAFGNFTARVIDRYYLSPLGDGNFSAYYGANKKLSSKERNNIRPRLRRIEKKLNIDMTRLQQQQSKLNTDTKLEETNHSTPPQQQIEPNTGTKHEETVHSAPPQQQIEPNTDIKYEKINSSTPRQHTSLWKNHWRSIIAILFGTMMLLLAFTPVGPALAAALGMKAIFAPVFTWIAKIGAAGIALGIGLFFSGFILGLPAWSLGMLAKLNAFVVLIINFINACVINFKNACERFCYHKDDFVFGKALFAAIPFLFSTIITTVLSAIELILLSIAEFGSRTFRQLGAWQARLFNRTPAASSEEIMVLPTLSTFLSTPNRPHSTYRAHFFPHLHALVSGQVKKPWSFEKDFILIRAQWLINDTLSTRQNPYDAAQENSSPKPSA